MIKKKRKFTSTFKTQVVLELLKEDQTVSQIASRYEICAKNLINWKKKFLENASLAFETNSVTKEYRLEIDNLQEENDELAKKVGKITIERDWLEKKLNSSVSLSDKKKIVEVESKLTISRQLELLEINRSLFYYKPVPIKAYDLDLMREIDEIYTTVSSCYGYRFIHQELLERSYSVGVNKVLKLMRLMGIQAIYPQKKNTSGANPEHKKYPYLLREFWNQKKQVISNGSNHIWSGDITYIPIKGGFMYLAAVIDWYSRAVLSWKISNTMDTQLVTSVLKTALDKYGAPQIFNSDQGAQYTSQKHIDLLESHGVRISMNGKGRSIDNIIVERFFRTLKYNNIYICDYQNPIELKNGIMEFMEFYNYYRFHSTLKYQKPMNVYSLGIKEAA
ncbi:MAG: IS3 family transposase [Gammaproteobacteria bacterium]|nr:IS3 family transposase [Gammaproteobacteria bacterium]